MGGSLILVHIATATIGVVVAVVALKLEPVIALVLGAAYLGLVTGQGPADTVATIVRGFADVMGEIGLLIAFGVLLGALVHALGVPQRIADGLLRALGRRNLPYAYGLTLGGLLASVFADVLIVLSGPLTRHASARMGPGGHGLLSGTAIIGIVIGLNFVVPGTGLMAVVGVLGIPLQSALLYALPLGLATIVVSVFVYSWLVRRGLWDERRDQLFTPEPVATSADNGGDGTVPVTGGVRATGERSDDGPHPEAVATGSSTAAAPRHGHAPLALLVSPLAVTVGLLLVSAIAGTAGADNVAIDIIGNPNVAVFSGLVLAYVLARILLPSDAMGSAIGRGLQTSGSILVLTGVSGGLAAVVKATGVGEVMGGWFTAGGAAPLLLTWVIAATLHMAVGSISLGSLTAAGILAPVAMAAGPGTAVMIALAALSGGLFGALPNANGFWLFRSVFDLSTRGTLKTYTLGPSIASVVSLVLLLLLDSLV
ncbi:MULTISPECIES: GntP family permease [unclassified Pseudonocardia]|uniref:GntP family permease n=1 Tax=unclassified Pseudonocardia TaxID=2619320 RepID=UPI001CF674F2|nr:MULTISPECIES: SLC13 family permease [unclassified Pseudonocardia]